MGRDEDRDITIADSTVSALHAAFDVVDVPGEGGGKRITLKVPKQKGVTLTNFITPGTVIEVLSLSFPRPSLNDS